MIRRQLHDTARSLLHPKGSLAAVREIALGAFYVATYPMGLVPGIDPIEMPFGPAGARHPLLDADAETAKVPVILLHGYVHNRSAFLIMGRALRRAGFEHVRGLNYNPLRCDIPTIAGMLATEVDRALRATDAERCMIVGHSMGGIVARYYTQELAPADVVDTVVTMAAPHRGTYAALLGYGPAAAQLRPGSGLLRRLEESARPSATRWLAYYSDLDFMVIPAANARLVHPALRAENIRVRDTGHLSVLLSGQALRSIVDHLAEPGLDRPRTRPGTVDDLADQRAQRRQRDSVRAVAPAAAGAGDVPAAIAVPPGATASGAEPVGGGSGERERPGAEAEPPSSA